MSSGRCINWIQVHSFFAHSEKINVIYREFSEKKRRNRFYILFIYQPSVRGELSTKRLFFGSALKVGTAFAILKIKFVQTQLSKERSGHLISVPEKLRKEGDIPL